MSNAFAVKEANASGDLNLYRKLKRLERERHKEERRFQELQNHFGLRALAYYTSPGAWPTNPDLPNDIVIHIFSYLDSLQVMKTRLVNHSFRNFVYSENMAPLVPKLEIEFFKRSLSPDAGPKTSLDSNESTVTVSNILSGTRVRAKGLSCLTVSFFDDEDLETNQVTSLRYLAHDLGDSVVELSISDLRCSKIMTCQAFIEMFKRFTSVTKLTLLAESKAQFIMPLIVVPFQKITHLDFCIEAKADEGDVWGSGRFFSFGELPSTLRELSFSFDHDCWGNKDSLDCISAMNGISKLVNLRRLDFGSLFSHYDDGDDPKELKSYSASFANMLGSLVNLEDINFPISNVLQHASSYLQADNQVMNFGPIKRIKLYHSLSATLSEYKNITKACNLQFPTLEELIIEDIDLGYGDIGTDLLSERMTCGLAKLQKHASLSKIIFIFDGSYGGEQNEMTLLSNLEVSLGGKIKVILQK